MSAFFLNTSIPLVSVSLLAFILFSIKKSQQLFLVGTLTAFIAFLAMTLTIAIAIIETGVASLMFGNARYIVFAWVIMCVYFIAEYHYRIRILGSILIPIASTFVLLSGLSLAPINERFTEFSGLTTGFHITLVFLGLGLLCLSFAAAWLFLLKSRALKHHQLAAMDDSIPALPISKRIMESAFTAGFACFTLGLIIGIVYAGLVLPHSWYQDVKIIWAIINWAVFSSLFFCHHSGRLHARQLARGIVLLFAFVLISFLFTTNHSFFTAAVHPPPMHFPHSQMEGR